MIKTLYEQLVYGNKVLSSYVMHTGSAYATIYILTEEYTLTIRTDYLGSIIDPDTLLGFIHTGEISIIHLTIIPIENKR
jgi:hypothetical protein